MNNKTKKIINLFFTMLKIGLFTFGGGYAMIALLQNEFVNKKHFMEKDEFLDMVAIAESTPGPIAINSATYIGYKTAGVLGSAAATLGVCIPSVVIIYVISLFFDAFLSLTFVQYAFKGIQACVVYLILSAGIKMFKGLKRTPFTIFIFSVVLCLMVAFSLLSVKFSAILYILICGLLGIVIYLLGLIKGKGE
ncbi:MAG: chromate transporter [Clostridia bacterium]|nr:chromate transporter [Clostridia bacterium]MBQ6816606.1 chromate transporter [Clostridia bacterium]